MRAKCQHPAERVHPIVRSGLILCADGEMRRGHVYRCDCGAVRALIGGELHAWVEREDDEPAQVTRLPERRDATSHAELRDAG